jgi:hypothetical protein
MPKYGQYTKYGLTSCDHMWSVVRCGCTCLYLTATGGGAFWHYFHSHFMVLPDSF